MSSAAVPSPSHAEAVLETLECHARELHAFLEDMPSQLNRERLGELGQTCRRLLESAPRSLEDPRLDAAWKHAHARLSELHAALAAAMPRARLLALHQDLARTYEQWIEQLRSARARQGGGVALESVKPLLWPRTLFHVAMGLVAAGVYQFVLGQAGCMVVLGTLLAIFTFLEVSRRFSPWWNDVLVSSLRLIARPREYHHVNSSTWYLLGLCVLVPLASQRAVIAAVLVLAFADPAAAWIGKNLGSRKLYRNKSLAGSLAFLGVAVALTWPYLASFDPALTPGRAGLLAVAGGLAGTLAELFSGRLDDNFTVPVITGLALTLCGA